MSSSTSPSSVAVSFRLCSALELPIDYGADNVGLAVRGSLLAFTTPIRHCLSLYDLRDASSALNVMSSDALDSAPDAIRGPTRVVLVDEAADAEAAGQQQQHLLLCGEFGNRWARLLDLGPARGADGARVLHTFTAGGLGVFAVAAGFGSFALGVRSEEADAAYEARLWVYDAATYALLGAGVSPHTHGPHWNSVLSCQFLGPRELLVVLRGYLTPVRVQLDGWTVTDVALEPPFPTTAQLSAAVQRGAAMLHVADVTSAAIYTFEGGVLSCITPCPNPTDLALSGEWLYALSAETNNARVLCFVEAFESC